jgi:hypothetical protein
MATGWHAENAIISIENEQNAITQTTQPSRFFEHLDIHDGTYSVTVTVTAGSAILSMDGVTIIDNVGPGTHSFTIVVATAGIHRFEFGTMAGATTTFDMCSLKKIGVA